MIVLAGLRLPREPALQEEGCYVDESLRADVKARAEQMQTEHLAEIQQFDRKVAR